MNYDSQYYQSNAQDKDRPALFMYQRLWKRYLGKGPVLEFGCGVGHFARRLSRYAEVYGLEVNSFALAEIKKRGCGVRAIDTTANLLPNSFESITAMHVLEHISDEQLHAVGLEFLRILKPGGRILAVMPNTAGKAHALKGSAWSAYGDPTHINLKSAHQWQVFFENVWNVRVKSRFADGYYDFPYGNSGARSFLGDCFRAGKTLLQFLIARPILDVHDGENVIFVLEKPV